MAFLAAKDRFQTRISSLEEEINKDNPFSFAVAFVDSLHLTTFTPNEPFLASTTQTNFQP